MRRAGRRDPGRPVWIAIADATAPIARESLLRLGFDYLVRRPVHAAASDYAYAAKVELAATETARQAEASVVEVEDATETGTREVIASFLVRGELQTLQFEMSEDDTPSSIALDLLDELGVEPTPANLKDFVRAIDDGISDAKSASRV